jgi:hypothetical protein
MAERTRELAILNLRIDSKLRALEVCAGGPILENGDFNPTATEGGLLAKPDKSAHRHAVDVI